MAVAVSVLAAATALTACTATTSGTATKLTLPVDDSSSVAGSPNTAASSATQSGSGNASATATNSAASSAPSSSVTIHPVAKVRTLTVAGNDGTSYDVTVWAQDSLATCQDHAYGAPMIAFLTSTPCQNTQRQLLTTTLNGRQVGISLILTSFNGSPDNPYSNAEKFKTLVEQDGTGDINDLMHEGYRLPSGPSKVPSPDAFAALSQDAGVEVFDLWYLTGATPNNAPELVALASELFLQTF